MIIKLKFLFVCILFYGKINSKVLLEVGPSARKYNSPTKIAFQNVTTENGKQYVNYEFNLAEDFGEKIGVMITVEYAAAGKRYIPVQSHKEKNACRTLNAFGGETWAKVQKSAGLLGSKCPIKPGVYKVEHLEVILDPVTLQMLPIGKVRINYTLIHNSDKIPFLGSYVILTRLLDLQKK